MSSINQKIKTYLITFSRIKYLQNRYVRYSHIHTHIYKSDKKIE
jgi:hypothetical protein